MPVFSIIIPTYNRSDLILRTIGTVTAQDFEDLEVIVVDDGSTDDTAEVVAAGVTDPRVSYHRKSNEERAAARNFGTKLASGDYVTFLDSDDLFYPDHLAVADEMRLKHAEPEWFHLGYEFQNADGMSSRAMNKLPAVGNDSLIHGNALSCRGVFLRRDIALEHPFNEDRSLAGTEDYELWMRLASRYPLHCDNRITSAIVQHDRRSVLDTDQVRLQMRIGLLEKYLAEDEKFTQRFGERISEFEANNRVYIALHLALSGKNRVGAVSYLRKALQSSPRALRNRAFYGTIKRIFIKYSG